MRLIIGLDSKAYSTAAVLNVHGCRIVLQSLMLVTLRVQLGARL